MLLIDSSAWIEFLRPKGSQKVKERVREALQREEAATCGIVIVEVSRGARNEKDYQALYDSLRNLPLIPIDDAVIGRASRWGYLLDRKGKVVSTTDLIIAAASHGRATVLHLDSDFEAIASEIEFKEERMR
jgi:predicted nucleic acid-binding protein